MATLGRVFARFRARRRRTLREGEHLCRHILGRLPRVALAVNGSGEILFVNSYTEALFGYGPAELIGESVARVLPGGLSGGAGTPRTGKRKDGSEFPVDLALVPIGTAGDAWVLSAAMFRDPREHEADERFRLAVEAAPNGMLVADQEGRIILVNSELERLFGYTRDEVIGQKIELLVPERDRPEHERFREVFTRQPRARSMSERSDLRGRRKDGSEFPVEVGLSPIQTRNGVWCLSAIVDIAERKRMEAQRVELLAKDRALETERALRETEAELARVLRALSVAELATSIAHEVNQPLVGVVTNAEAGLRWLCNSPPNIEEARRSLALIIRDGNRASAVLRRIRRFLIKQAPQDESLDVNELIMEAIALVHTKVLKHQVQLLPDLASGLPPVRGDRIQLEQVMVNLLINGVEAMMSGAGAKELRVGSSPGPSGEIFVAVEDSGSGARPEDLHRLFDPFFTTKADGMGMGLTLSRTIIEAHGGRIWAERKESGGLTVRFQLPAASGPRRRAGRQE